MSEVWPQKYFFRKYVPYILSFVLKPIHVLRFFSSKIMRKDFAWFLHEVQMNFGYLIFQWIILCTFFFFSVFATAGTLEHCRHVGTLIPKTFGHASNYPRDLCLQCQALESQAMTAKLWVRIKVWVTDPYKKREPRYESRTRTHGRPAKVAASHSGGVDCGAGRAFPATCHSLRRLRMGWCGLLPSRAFPICQHTSSYDWFIPIVWLGKKEDLFKKATPLEK